MRLAAAALTLMLLTGTAYAQGINLWPTDSTRDPAEEEKQREIDKAYKAKIQSQKVPAQAPVSDPWGGVRASETPSPNKTQTGTKNR